MNLCDVCGNKADKHHIIYKSQGGLDYPLNYKYLCANHHRGREGPHKNNKVDLQYKLELQNKLQTILCNSYYTFDELINLLNISKNLLKRLSKNLKLHKEGYKSSEIIYLLMGRKVYKEEMLEDLEIELLLANY
ncbi:hypothetical protein SAMN05444401_2798 [Clostridium amylolyticum]|uniref:HNH endonuclease n=1 Tax=Clostridium amylolyticum TaxID=1121298 RepID=A0A1M6IFM7_9CLOT|nr:HNH endonuclease [Clostridium amylolyticum]SHJ33277.1 hypothetical protein SAMN05444401_2798 [Clostridium amylolyticum]